MLKFLGLLLLVVIVIQMISKKIVIRFDTFLFRKGFRKNNDYYRRVLLGSVNSGDR